MFFDVNATAEVFRLPTVGIHADPGMPDEPRIPPVPVAPRDAAHPAPEPLMPEAPEEEVPTCPYREAWIPPTDERPRHPASKARRLCLLGTVALAIALLWGDVS
jgi:hypothetical protein